MNPSDSTFPANVAGKKFNLTLDSQWSHLANKLSDW